eukprot:329213_1
MYEQYAILNNSNSEHFKKKQLLIIALINITSKTTSSSMSKIKNSEIKISQKHQRAKNRLYRYGGQGFISRNIKIGKALQQFESLNKQISFESQVHWNIYDINHNNVSNNQMLTSLMNSDGNNLCYLVNYEWKYNLVNAWSTIHFLQINYPALFCQLSHELLNNKNKSAAIIPPKRSKSEKMALEMFNTVNKASTHLDGQLVHFTDEFQQKLSKIQHKVKIDLCSDELSKIYFDQLEDEYTNDKYGGDENEMKMDRELHTKQFLMSVDFSAKKHHIWLYLAPILTGIYLQKEYNEIMMKMPQFLLQSLMYNIFNNNNNNNNEIQHNMNEFIELP